MLLVYDSHFDCFWWSMIRGQASTKTCDLWKPQAGWGAINVKEAFQNIPKWHILSGLGVAQDYMDSQKDFLIWLEF